MKALRSRFGRDLFLLIILSFLISSFLQPNHKGKPPRNILQNLLLANPNKFSKVLSNPKSYRVQIIYTQINRDEKNIPHFKQYSYRINPKEYFYPASLVKIPAVALSLQKLNELNIRGLDKSTRMKIDSAYFCQAAAGIDTTAKDGFPSIGHYIKKALLVSDNDAFNRLYEFLGQEYLNNELWKREYTSVRITNRLTYCDTLSNRYTNPMAFYNPKGEIIYKQPLAFNPKQFKNSYGKFLIGKGFLDFEGKLSKQPKDFTFANYLSLRDINDIFISIIFPESFPKEKQFNLSPEDYQFLYRYLSMYPSESDYPAYSRKEFGDSFKKYFIYGSNKDTITQDSIRIFNHVGQAYGFLSDCAYIVDFKNKVEFLLSATIYVNSDGILNDGKYEYAEIGFPFLANLGKVVYQYERKRKRKVIPDVSSFRMTY